MTDPAIIPFRWNLSRREQLGGLIPGESAEVPESYYEHLRNVSAKLVARSQGSDLVFVGRSPEHIFDYLSGTYSSIPELPTLTLLQFSKAYSGAYRRPLHDPYEFNEAEKSAFLDYLKSQAIDPESLARAKRPVRFVDMVSSGATFIMLLALLREITKKQGADWNVVAKRLGFLGITYQKKNSPNTFRWQQSRYWIEAGGSTIDTKNVSTPFTFWGHAANEAEKVTPSFHRRRWFSPEYSQPQRSEDALKALRRSVEIFDLGKERNERLELAKSFAKLQEFREPWLRNLVFRLKQRAGAQ